MSETTKKLRSRLPTELSCSVVRPDQIDYLQKLLVAHLDAATINDLIEQKEGKVRKHCGCICGSPFTINQLTKHMFTMVKVKDFKKNVIGFMKDADGKFPDFVNDLTGNIIKLKIGTSSDVNLEPKSCIRVFTNGHYDEFLNNRGYTHYDHTLMNDSFVYRYWIHTAIPMDMGRTRYMPVDFMLRKIDCDFMGRSWSTYYIKPHHDSNPFLRALNAMRHLKKLSKKRSSLLHLLPPDIINQIQYIIFNEIRTEIM